MNDPNIFKSFLPISQFAGVVANIEANSEKRIDLRADVIAP